MTNNVLLLILVTIVCYTYANQNNYNSRNRDILSEEKSGDNLERKKRQVDLEIGQTKKNKFIIKLPTIKHKIGIENQENLNTEENEIKENKSTFGPIVTTSDGQIKGKVINENDLKFYSFQGIPYAEKPVRFQPSKPVKPWHGVKETVAEPPNCFQKDIFGIVGGNEDCLNLNINTPTLEDRKLPVIIWIYGGGFKFGSASSSIYNPERLIRENIIVVSIYYRIGALGFLNTNTKHAPGNVGMKDIVIALRWINKNIHMFGGDTNNLCLYGISSGAAAVEFLTLSPITKGLFHKAIIHSGSALCHIFYSENTLKTAFRLGEYLGFVTRNVDELMEFLHKKNASSIVDAAENMDIDNIYSFSLNFVPSLEKSLPSTKERFLTEEPETILKSGNYNHVPLLIGFNDKEGLYFTNKIKNFSSYLTSINDKFENTLPPDLLGGVESETKRELMKRAIKEYYFKNKTLGIDTVENYVDMISDSVFLYGIHKSVKIRSAKLKYPIYYHEFGFYDYTKLSKFNKVTIKGAGHAEDLPYIFKLPNIIIGERGEAVSEKYVKLYSNFAKYSNPTPSITKLLPTIWTSIENNDLTVPYLRVTETLEMKHNPNKERMDFWTKMYSMKLT